MTDVYEYWTRRAGWLSFLAWFCDVFEVGDIPRGFVVDVVAPTMASDPDPQPRRCLVWDAEFYCTRVVWEDDGSHDVIGDAWAARIIRNDGEWAVARARETWPGDDIAGTWDRATEPMP